MEQAALLNQETALTGILTILTKEAQAPRPQMQKTLQLNTACQAFT
jgi:hypothetical protein